jgi:hypothetical protein
MTMKTTMVSDEKGHRYYVCDEEVHEDFYFDLLEAYFPNGTKVYEDKVGDKWCYTRYYNVVPLENSTAITINQLKQAFQKQTELEGREYENKI